MTDENKSNGNLSILKLAIYLIFLLIFGFMMINLPKKQAETDRDKDTRISLVRSRQSAYHEKLQELISTDDPQKLIEADQIIQETIANVSASYYTHIDKRVCRDAIKLGKYTSAHLMANHSKENEECTRNIYYSIYRDALTRHDYTLVANAIIVIGKSNAISAKAQNFWKTGYTCMPRHYEALGTAFRDMRNNDPATVSISPHEIILVTREDEDRLASEAFLLAESMYLDTNCCTHHSCPELARKVRITRTSTR
jgi:hypothetical protein